MNLCARNTLNYMLNGVCGTFWRIIPSFGSFVLKIKDGVYIIFPIYNISKFVQIKWENKPLDYLIISHKLEIISE